MRISLLAAAIAVVSACSPVMAADLMVSSAPAAMMAASTDWTGPYIGGTVGVVNLSTDVDNILFEGTDSGLDPYTIDSSGWLAGLTVGVNQQWDNIVAGVEGDISWSNAEGTYTDDIAAYSITTRLKTFATLRARLGFAVDQLLLYGTAGLAYGSIEAQLDDDYAGPTTLTTTDTQGQFGWTAGLGAELAVSDNISIKAEGLYYDLGTATYEFPEGPPGYDMVSADGTTTGWLARVGANFRF
jgi:outer membrane immunogenic protein